jgi:hypothetical protein
MKILNYFILILLIITIEPFTSFEKKNLYIFNNGLVFIKPENLTKAELVEKYKDLSSSNSLKELKNIKNEDNRKDEDKKDRISVKDFLKTNYLRILSYIFKFKNFYNQVSFIYNFNKIF